MADIFLILLVAFALGLSFYLFWQDRRMTRLEQMRIQKMRGSDMYARLYPALRRLRRRDIEQVRIRPEGVAVTLLSQPGRGYRFNFEELGLRPLTFAQMTTLALVLERDVEVLADRSRYRFKRQRPMLPNGGKTLQYVYLIKPAYKSAVNQAPYYEKVA